MLRRCPRHLCVIGKLGRFVPLGQTATGARAGTELELEPARSVALHSWRPAGAHGIEVMSPGSWRPQGQVGQQARGVRRRCVSEAGFGRLPLAAAKDDRQDAYRTDDGRLPAVADFARGASRAAQRYACGGVSSSLRLARPHDARRVCETRPAAGRRTGRARDWGWRPRGDPVVQPGRASRAVLRGAADGSGHPTRSTRACTRTSSVISPPTPRIA
jgi:hypothetical protein